MIDAHRAAFEYDWRTRFDKTRGLAVIGTKRMPWGEAGRLARVLAGDTASAVGASLSEWQYPASREALALMDLYDAFASANFKRPKPYPRPWDPPPKVIGNARLTPGELRAILDEHRGVTSHKRDKNGRLHDVRGRFVKDVG